MGKKKSNFEVFAAFYIYLQQTLFENEKLIHADMYSAPHDDDNRIVSTRTDYNRVHLISVIRVSVRYDETGGRILIYLERRARLLLGGELAFRLFETN